jgi:hypothetical protein
MSPTFYVVRMADLDEHLEAARSAGNLRRMQRLPAEMTSWRRAMYG